MVDYRAKNSIVKFYKKDNMPACPGNSAQDGTLRYMHKIVPDDADATKEKYTSGHYIKDFAVEKRYGNGVVSKPGAIEQAWRELATLEFLRLMIPGQPKARLLQDPQDTQVCYLQSKEIKNASTLYRLDLSGEVNAKKNIFEKADIAHYGTPDGYKRLGEINFIIGGLFIDKDIAGRNYLVDDQNILYRIDAGETIWATNWFDNSIFKQFLGSAADSQAYIKEQNAALLKFLTLPPILIKAFCRSYFLDDETRQKREDYLIDMQDSIKMEYIKDNGYIHPNGDKRYLLKFDVPSKNIFPNFAEYIISDEARDVLKNYADYLETFNIYGKTKLIEQCGGEWRKEDIAACHQSLINELTQYELIPVDVTCDMKPLSNALLLSEQNDNTTPALESVANQQQETTDTTLSPRTITKAELSNILYGRDGHAGYHTKSWFYYFFHHFFHLNHRRSGTIIALFNLLDQEKNQFEEKDIKTALSAHHNDDKYKLHRLSLFEGKDSKNGSSTDDILDELRIKFNEIHLYNAYK